MLFTVRILHCENHSHVSLIQKYHDDIVQSCLDSCKNSIPHSKVKQLDEQCNNIPGWSEHAEPARDRALLWHTIWKDSGSPREGIIAKIRQSTRAQYHRIVKHL